MKTESLARQARVNDRHQVSRALREAAPHFCQIETANGRPVRLTSAGFVLTYHGNFRLRVATAFTEHDLPEARLIQKPDFVETEAPLKEVDEQGRLVFVFPFRIPFKVLDAASISKVFIVAGELNVSVQSKAMDECRYGCPVCVWPGLKLAFIYLLIVVATAMIPQIILTPLAAEQDPLETIVARLRPFTYLNLWLWSLGFASTIFAILAVINAFLLYGRSRELRRDFRGNYPALSRAEQ